MHLSSKKFKSTQPGSLTSIVVNGDMGFAMRQWKKMQKDSKIIVECFERKFYQKPSDKKRKMMEIARYNQSKNLD